MRLEKFPRPTEEWRAFGPLYPRSFDYLAGGKTLDEAMEHISGYFRTFPPSRPPDARTAAPEAGAPNDSAETRNAASAAHSGTGRVGT